MTSGAEHTPWTSVGRLWLNTIRGLLEWKRLVPIAVLAAPLMASQHAYSYRPYLADAIALSMVVGCLVIAPFAWRLLFGEDRRLHSPLRWALYPLIGLLPLWAGFEMTQAVETGSNFLIDSLNGAVAAGLFLVGGWGLGRDIELEQGLISERARAEQAELLAMRAHLDPHFLFNTLNAIAEWCTLDAARAEEAILRLSKVLRRVMSGIRSHTWPLNEELGVVRDVLELHLVRDPEWFEVEWVLGDFEASIPPLLLLPLVDNAVKHGPMKGYRGTISIRTRQERGRVTIEIRSPGPYGGPRSGGEGTRMVRDRLAISCGSTARFEIGPSEETTLAVVGYDLDRLGSR